MKIFVSILIAMTCLLHINFVLADEINPSLPTINNQINKNDIGKMPLPWHGNSGNGP